MESERSSSRIKSILNCKKPAFWIILVLLLAGIVTAVHFLAVPKKDKADAKLEATFAPDAMGTALDESDLLGEWLVQEETDNDGNVLYTFGAIGPWKEYNFRDDGTVIYNETVPYSSDYELAFGHPVTYPYEVHDDLVYIAGDDRSGASRWGSYDRDTRILTLMYSTPDGTVYAKLKHMGEGARDDAALDEATLCTIWSLSSVVASDGSDGNASWFLGMEQYLQFRSDGTIRIDTFNAQGHSEEIQPYTLSGEIVTFGNIVLKYDPKSNELRRDDPDSDDLAVWIYVRTPNVILPPETDVPDIDAQTIEEMLLGTYTCTAAKAGRNAIAIPKEYVGMQIDLNDPTALPDVDREREYFHFAAVTISGVEKTGYDWTVDAKDMLTVWNAETGDSWTFRWLRLWQKDLLLLTLAETDPFGNPIVLIFPID